ncbi:chorismate-binding protein [Cesiribacter sp. SM1]|uniref:chorismate-binding protein n=1 Tax=Cesiribacter sp. SM1 TaxID=2861196 RepID=UPI001CD578F1|nr:chorismate-binding protein [Cesiribacter sp. SM1]
MKATLLHTELVAPLQELSIQEQFEALLKTALAEGYPVAAWRLPGEQYPSLLIDLSGTTRLVNPDLEQLPAGFLAAPYKTDLAAADAEENPQCHFLKADLYWNGAEESFSLADSLSEKQKQNATLILEKAPEQLQASQPAYPTAEVQLTETSMEQYLSLVQDSVAAIKRGEFQKNVCARTKLVDLPEAFRLEKFFKALSSGYPNAFVSVVAAPQIGTWVGATPEILISVDKQQRFKTVALAGTQPKQPGMSPVDAVWRQKEIEEQALVSRYIINCLKKIRVREFDEIGPRTIAAANLLHLRTDYIIDLREVNYPNLPTVMLQLLHPTSAVCGLPKEPAAAFLEEHERLDRRFFAGFLGPVNLQGETHLFVNLRCMQLLEEKALLYAGAGITADSVPEREWQETEHKCFTLLEVLQQAQV